MANALTDFIRKRDFLVCMDSDGCVMDTVRIKHCSVFCPELIRVFGLEAHTDFITTAWEEINLNSITRGISRFESAVLIFDRLKNRGIDVPGSEDIAAWVSTASELSTASLQQEVLRSGSLALRKLQEWNNACNRRIQALEPTFKPFPGVEYSLHQLHTVADVAVVSAANESAIASEWARYGLATHADVIFGQEVGSKANSIASMLACGYESRKVVMVGDAHGRCPGSRCKRRFLCAHSARPRSRKLAPFAGRSPAQTAARHFQPRIPGNPAGSAAQRSARVIDRKIVEQKPKQSMQKRILCFFHAVNRFWQPAYSKTSPALSRMLPIISLSQCTPEISRPTTIRAVNAASRGRRMCRTAGQRMRRCSFSLNSIKHLFSCRVSACFTVPPCACPLLWRHQGLWGRWFSRQGAAAWRAGWHPRQSGRAGHRRHGPAFPVYRFWLDR